MTDLSTYLYNKMSASRKRKLSETSDTSCSSLDSVSNDSESSKDVSKLRKIILHSNDGRKSETQSSSKSDSENCEQCPICLISLTSQPLGITDTCRHHTFCLSCLEEWSKTKKTCPVDRKEYQSILALDSKGNVLRQLPLRIVDEYSSPYEPVFCEGCGLYNNEEMMLVCEGCTRGYHLYCLVPQLETLPIGNWLCNDCWYHYN